MAMIPDKQTLLEKYGGERPRSRWLALFFSALIPGAGQLYNGEHVKGVLILLLVVGASAVLGDAMKNVISLLSTDEGLQAVLSGDASVVSPDGLIAAGVLQIVVLYSLWDAYRGPRRTPPGDMGA